MGLRDRNSNVTPWIDQEAGRSRDRVRGPLKLVNVDVESAQYALWHGMGLVLLLNETITILVKLKHERGVRPIKVSA